MTPEENVDDIKISLLEAVTTEVTLLKEELTYDRRARLERALMHLANLAVSTPSKQRDDDMAITISILADYKAVAACVLLRTSGRVAEAAGNILAQVGRGLLLGAVGMP